MCLLLNKSFLKAWKSATILQTIENAQEFGGHSKMISVASFDVGVSTAASVCIMIELGHTKACIPAINEYTTALLVLVV